MNLTNKLKSLLFVSILSLSGTQTKPMWSCYDNMKDKVGNFFSTSNAPSETEGNQEQEEQQENNTQNTPVEKNETNKTATKNKTPKEETWGKRITNTFKTVRESLISTKQVTTGLETSVNNIQEAATTVNKTTNNIAALWAGFLKVGQDMQKIHPVLGYTPHALIGFAGLTFLRMPITSILLGLGTLAYFNSNALSQDVKAYQDDKDENKTFQFNHMGQALEQQKTSLGFALLAGIGLGILKNTF